MLRSALLLCCSLAFIAGVFTNEAVRTCSSLTHSKCQPCEGKVAPYSDSAVRAQLALLEGWTLSTSAKGCLQISRTWRVKNFLTALSFLRDVGDLAEREGHHPDMHLTSYRNVTLDLSTHAICGLSENDFILAAKVNEIKVELKADGDKLSTVSPVASIIGKVHMLCGMISSGKSTYAKQLHEHTHAVLFSPDDWMLSLYGEDFPVERFQEHGDVVKAHIWELAQEFLQRGIDVVLDFSLWAKAERQLWRGRAEAVGAEVQLYYLQCPASVMLERLRARNARVEAGLERHFLVAEKTFESWLGFLEPPTTDENAIIVDSCTPRT